MNDDDKNLIQELREMELRLYAILGERADHDLQVIEDDPVLDNLYDAWNGVSNALRRMLSR